MSHLNARQERILTLMRARGERDLYETAAPGNSSVGSGQYAVTYSGDERYEYLSTAEVQELERLGLIEQLYPGCYTLAGAVRYDRKGNRIARQQGSA